MTLGTNGLLDSAQFSSVEGFHTLACSSVLYPSAPCCVGPPPPPPPAPPPLRRYQKRVRSTAFRYALSHEDQEDSDYAGVPVLPEGHKKVYRTIAEVLLHAYVTQSPHMVERLAIVRHDEALFNEVRKKKEKKKKRKGSSRRETYRT